MGIAGGSTGEPYTALRCNWEHWECAVRDPVVRRAPSQCPMSVRRACDVLREGNAGHLQGLCPAQQQLTEQMGIF